MVAAVTTIFTWREVNEMLVQGVEEVEELQKVLEEVLEKE